MSVAVFYTLLHGGITAERYQQQLQSFPVPIRESISRYVAPGDRHLRITGKCLLLHALEQSGLYPDLSLDHYRHLPGERPFFAGSGIRFSIAHSADMVLCAVSPAQSVGIDVEQIRPFRPDLMASCFHPESWQEIMTAEDRTAAFYRHWTSMEAALKAAGRGIQQQALPDIRILANQVILGNLSYYTRFLSLQEGYIVCLATEQEPEAIMAHAIAEEQLC